MAKRKLDNGQKIAIALMIPYVFCVIVSLYFLNFRAGCPLSEEVEREFPVIVNSTNIRDVTEIQQRKVIIHHICVPYLHGFLGSLATALLGVGKCIYQSQIPEHFPARILFPLISVESN